MILCLRRSCAYDTEHTILCLWRYCNITDLLGYRCHKAQASNQADQCEILYYTGLLFGQVKIYRPVLTISITLMYMGENWYRKEIGELSSTEKYSSWNIIVVIVIRQQDGRPRNRGSVRGSGTRFISLPNGPDAPTLEFVRYRRHVPVDKVAETYSSPLTYI